MSSKFQRGSGCYKCNGCGKQTRDVGDRDATDCRLCVLCYAKSSCGNALSDSAKCPSDIDPWGVFDVCSTPEECEALLTKYIGRD